MDIKEWAFVIVEINKSKYVARLTVWKIVQMTL